MKKCRINVINIMIWLAVGIMAAAVPMLMYSSDSDSLNEFYKCGKVCDVTHPYRESDSLGYQYSAADGCFLVTEAEAHKQFDTWRGNTKWNYMIMELSHLNVEELPAQLVFLSADWEILATKDVLLHEGENVIKKKGKRYRYVDIVLRDCQGVTLSIDKLQFRVKMLSYDPVRAAGVFAAAFLMYLLVTGGAALLLRRSKKRPDWYRIIEGLQSVYLLVGEAGGRFFGRLRERARAAVRTALFLFLILYMMVVMDLHLYEGADYLCIHCLVGSVVFMLLGFLCYEKQLVRIAWNRRLAGAWLVLWLLACVSDVIVQKRYAYQGYIMVFVLGYFYFMWNNMRDRRQVFRDLIAAIHISFAVTTVFCFLCRPWTEGMRYLGSYYRPGMYGMYLLFVCIALLWCVDRELGRDGLSWRLFLFVTEFTLAGFLLWKTQSSSGIIPVFAAFVIWMFYRFVLLKGRARRKKTLAVIALMILTAVPVSYAGTWGLLHLPHILGTEIKIKSDADFDITVWNYFEPKTVYAGQGEAEVSIMEHRIIKKLFGGQSLEKITSMRNLYWAAHLREMNLTGHAYKAKIWGGTRWPHNGVIAMMYRYGIFAGIPYTVMVGCCFFGGWRYLRRNTDSYGYFMFASMAACVFLILMENLELPFLYLCWIVMYTLMGELFAKEGGKAKERAAGGACQAN